MSWLFVCRGSAEHGLGHVIRTRAVAEALPPGTQAEVVAIGDSLAAAMLDGLELPWSVVGEDSDMAGRTAEVVVFDTIPLEAAVFEALADGALTASLSPIFDHLDRVDVAFNRTRYSEAGPAPDDPRLLYGLEYAIVREACRPIDTKTFEAHLAEDPLSIAISMGGADAPNRTLRVLDALRDVRAPATFWVLLGEGYAHSYRDLVESVKRDARHEVVLAKTNRSMWRILRNCSLAILAGGVTTYEAARAGLPSVNLVESAGHAFLVRELAERGAAIDAGVLDDAGLASLRATIDRLEQSREDLLQMHLAAKPLIDGEGARRVVEAIAERQSSRSGVSGS